MNRFDKGDLIKYKNNNLHDLYGFGIVLDDSNQYLRVYNRVFIYFPKMKKSVLIKHGHIEKV